MRGDLLDLALIVVAAAFAVSGYRQGFIVGSLSFIGFVGGAVLGAQFGPAISRAIAPMLGVAGQELSLPPNGITIHCLPLTVIMRFWSH